MGCAGDSGSCDYCGRSGGRCCPKLPYSLVRPASFLMMASLARVGRPATACRDFFPLSDVRRSFLAVAALQKSLVPPSFTAFRPAVRRDLIRVRHRSPSEGRTGAVPQHEGTYDVHRHPIRHSR